MSRIRADVDGTRFIAARVIIGAATNFASISCIAMISELAHPRLRGSVLVLQRLLQLTLTFPTIAECLLPFTSPATIQAAF